MHAGINHIKQRLKSKYSITALQWLLLVRYQFFSIFLKRKVYKAENSIIIFSEARGGSTWLMEILANIPKTCINWEPLHLDLGVVPKQYQWGVRPLIHEKDKSPEYIQLMRKILEFSIHSPWTIKHLTIRKLLDSEYVITKFVRANLLIPYILNNFHLRFSPILLIRNPVDVSVSYIKAFHKNNPELQKYEVPNCINNQRYIQNSEFILNLDSVLEVQIAKWCLNNVSILNSLDTYKNIIIVFYEDLLMYPERETMRILKELKIASDHNKVINSVNFKQSSKTDFNEDFKNDIDVQLQKNYKVLSAEDKNKIQLIYDHFNFKLYNAYSPYPEKQFVNI